LSIAHGAIAPRRPLEAGRAKSRLNQLDQSDTW
jgi:hypothetical protein